jgi:ATP-dependent Clp protease adapter protein ClpS
MSTYLTYGQAVALTLPTEPWLSCEDCFRLVDAYVDTLLGATAGAPLDQAAMTAMQVHLAGCGACEEEARSLVELAGGWVTDGA